MSLKEILRAVAVAGLAIFTAAGFAQESPVKPGEPVPALKVAQWVQGGPIPQFERGKVYLVEFWATWCGPCIANIPHLNELHQRHAKDGFVVIGMTNPDVDAGSKGARPENNTLEQVRTFVAKQGDAMSYPIAYDTPMRATFKQMMRPNAGIPHAFLIGRDGRLIAHDHPVYLDYAIERVIAGTWDPGRDYPQIARSKKLYSDALSAKDYASFKSAMAQLETDFPALGKQVVSTKFSRALAAGDLSDMAAAARAMIADSRRTNATVMLGAMAQRTAHDIVVALRSSVAGLIPDGKGREVLAIAREMSAGADEISGGRDGYAKSALAELAFFDGDNARAVELQKQAIELYEHAGLKEREGKRLVDFERALETQRLIERHRASRET